MIKNKIIYFVGTPISNPEDITVRALKILQTSEVIFTESIRSITTLLKYHHISYERERIILYDEKKVKFSEIENEILSYQRISYVSESGMPVFMDPGKELLEFAQKNQYQIQVVPGISALSTALVYAGINSPFYFAGFPPKKNFLRISFFRNLNSYQIPIVLYETPFRIRKLLKELKGYLRGEWEITIAMDLTGKKETIIKNVLKDISISKIENLEKLPAVLILKPFLNRKSKS